jgi:hypothetical protein
MPRLVPPPPVEENLVVNGGFEQGSERAPSGWIGSGGDRPGATLGAHGVAGAPEGARVAEISLEKGHAPQYGLTLEQDLRLDYQTTYDLSAWVRGVDLVSAVQAPRGFGRECGIFFWIRGPSNAQATRVLPASAGPRQDGTTPWELRTMRFTTPPRDAFKDRSPDGDDRLHLTLYVQLYGTGTIQVDDIRLARSTASPPPARRTPGRLAFAQPQGSPIFGMGLFWLPVGTTWKQVAAEKIFSFSGGLGDMRAKARLGIPSTVDAIYLDPGCDEKKRPAADPCADAATCLLPRPCSGYNPDLLATSGTFIAWKDEENFWPEAHGDLAHMIEAARRIHADARRLRPDRPVYILASDMPAGVYYNTYGWDDLAAYHASEAFDIAAGLRRGGNPRQGFVGSVMSQYPETSINGIRLLTLQIAEDVTDAQGRQSKPVYLFVNGGSSKIVTDRSDPSYPAAPHSAAELLAMRPSRAQLRYMLYAAILNGATGFFFYQDQVDTLLTAKDPYWLQVLLPNAAELVTLEKQTGFLTQAEVNPAPYHLTGSSDEIDSMLKRVGDAWILAVANANPVPASGVEFEPGEGWRIDGDVQRLVYRHAGSPAQRKLDFAPAAKSGAGRIALDLPGYGVLLLRFRLVESGEAPKEPAAIPIGR